MKTMLQRLSALLMALALLCGCALAEGSPADVMATVNGAAITRAEFDACLDTLITYANGGVTPTDETMLNAYRETALMTLVQLVVMDQKIEEMNLTLTDAEKADAAQLGRDVWAEDVSNAMVYYGLTSTSTEGERAAILVQVLADLEAAGYTEQSYIDDAITEALYLKLEDEIARDVVIPDEDVAVYYNQLVEADREVFSADIAAYEQALQLNEFYLTYGYTDAYTDIYYTPAGYRCMLHILLDADVDLMTAYADLQAVYEEQPEASESIEGGAVTDEDLENARLAIIADVQNTLDEIHAQLEEGADFATLIPRYTVDAFLDDPEEISAGVAVHMDSILHPTDYRNAAFSIEQAGGISEPVVTEDGVYVLYYAGDMAGGAAPYTADLREELRAALYEMERNAVISMTLDAWMEEADVVYADTLDFLAQ